MGKQIIERQFDTNSQALANPYMPKFLQIKKSISDKILSKELKVGELIPSERELAVSFNVDKNTVVKALHELKLEGFLHRVQGKGTFVAEGRKDRRRSGVSHLAIFLNSQESIIASGNAQFVYNFLHGCTLGAEACGADLTNVSCPDHATEEEMQEKVTRLFSFDGAILFGLKFPQLYFKLKDRKFPFVTLEEPVPIRFDEPFPGGAVTYDRREAVGLAVRHLMEHGNRRIGFLGRMDKEWRVKFDYFTQALTAAGISPDASLFEHCIFASEAQIAAERLMARVTRPEAVFVDDYQHAQILVREARRRQIRVPEDLAVMAYGTQTDDFEPLSMMGAPSREMGHEAAVLLDQLVRGKITTSTQRMLKAHLMIRRSCGCGNRQEAATARDTVG